MRETTLELEGSFTNVNVLLQRVTSTWISTLLPFLLFLKIKQPKIITIPKRHILVWQTLRPFRGLACGDAAKCFMCYVYFSVCMINLNRDRETEKESKGETERQDRDKDKGTERERVSEPLRISF